MEFNSDFLKKEVRCGFEIPVMMKRAWAAQMEILKIIDEICKKNNLRYFASYGTLLGAVRHKGYIPWDDDIDLGMLREDYMKLIKILPEQLPPGFVVTGIHAEKPEYQTAETWQLMVAADRDLWDINEYMKFFHGYPYKYVCVDIFPFDYVSNDEEEYKLQKALIQKGSLIVKNWEVLKKANVLEKYLNDYEAQTGVTLPRENAKVEMLRLMDALARLNQSGEKVEVMLWEYILHYQADWFQNTVNMPFENTEIPVPAEYDRVLRTVYGDYLQPVKGTAVHGYPFYKEMNEIFEQQLKDADVPYTVEDFCKKVMNDEIHVDWV